MIWLEAMTDDWWAGFVCGVILDIENYLQKWATFQERYGL